MYHFTIRSSFLSLLTSLILVQPVKATVKQVIHHDAIVQSGITRPGDLLMLCEGWNLITLDGFTWNAEVNGLLSGYTQAWQIMLDNQLLPLNILQNNQINLLPISIDLIDSVEIYSFPQLVNGTFTEKGLIHIHTIKPQTVAAIRAYLEMANETGDPGPYKYTELQTSNIDRVGLDQTASADVRFRRFYARANGIVQQHTFTDWTIKRRIMLISPLYDWPGMDRIVAGGKIGYDGSGGNIEIAGAHSFMRQYYLLIKPYGREIPVQHIYSYLGLSGQQRFLEHFTLSGQSNYTENQLKEYPNVLDLNFDWWLVQAYLNLSLEYRQKHYQALLGSNFRRLQLKTNQPVNQNIFDIAKIYGSFSMNSLDGLAHQLGLQIAKSGQHLEPKIQILNIWQLYSHFQLFLNAAYTQELREDIQDLWFWQQAGYRLLDRLGVTYTYPQEQENPELYSLDIGGQAQPFRPLTIKASLGYRCFRRLLLEKQLFNFDAEEEAFHAPIAVIPDQQGELISAQLTLELQHYPIWRHYLHYHYTKPLSGTPQFNAYYQNLPMHRVTYQITFAPVANFNIWAMLSYLSATWWPEYAAIEGLTSWISYDVYQTYSARIPERWILDIQFQKWFWNRHFELCFGLRNIADQNTRFHPVGAHLNLTFQIKVKYYFGI